MTRFATTLAVLVASVASVASAQQGETQTRQIIIDPHNPHHVTGRYSEKLQCYFSVERVTAAGHCFTAARLTSAPLAGSPLNQLGLRRGDIISRLDNIRVTSYFELDNHYADTTVRYLRLNDGYFRDGHIFIHTHGPVGPVNPIHPGRP